MKLLTNNSLLQLIKLVKTAIKGKADKNHTHDIYEANLHWGGRNIAEDISPVDAAMSNLHSANRFAFSNPNGITIEYSRDGGSSWQSYPTTDSEKIAFVSGKDAHHRLGNVRTGTTLNDKLRITLNARTMGVYTYLKKILFNISTGGAGDVKCLVEKAYTGSETNFSTVGTYNVAGWSGWNSIPLTYWFGGGPNQTSNVSVLRFTFSIGKLNPSASNECSVISIIGLGTTYWQTPSNMARNGHLYSYDENQNAKFPSTVEATNFKGNLQGNADTATNASKVNNHTVESNVPANAKFTDTVYAHPTSHPASMITQDATHRFTTDTEKNSWNSKANSVHNHQASQVTFTDGKTFQQKLDAGELTGPQGERGLQGIQGAKGEQGIPGAKGDKGDMGPRGYTGERGPQGLKGDTGAQGERGPQGYSGANGTSAAWFTGTSVSGTSQYESYTYVSGSKAGDMYLNTSTYNVYRATSSNYWVYVCNIKGAQGYTGSTGPQGPRGYDGADGLTTSVTVNGTRYTHYNGNISLPSYPTLSSLNGVSRNDLGTQCNFVLRGTTLEITTK